MITLAQISGSSTIAIGIAAGFIVGTILTIIAGKIISAVKTSNLKKNLQKQMEEANRQAEEIIKTARLEATAEILKKKEEFTGEINQAKAELREADAD